MIIKMFIQNEKGSRFRNRYNEKTLEYEKTSELSADAEYQYGFIPGTLGEDGDCIDVWLISDENFSVGSTVSCMVLGVLEMFEDDGFKREKDYKVIVRPENEELLLAEAVLTNIKNFTLEIFTAHPDVKVSFGRLLSADAAEDIITSSIND